MAFTVSIDVADTNLKVGETSLVTFTFSEAVSDFTYADLSVANGALSALGSSDGGLTWTATLTPTDGVGAAINVITLNNAGVLDSGGQPGTGETHSNNYAVDTAPPHVTSVGVPGNGVYAEGAELYFTVNFSEAVVVSGGTPRIGLVVGSNTLSYATYAGGSGTTTLAFRYIVQPGDADADGLTLDVVDLNGGTLLDAAGNAAELTLNNVPPTAGVLVDALAPARPSAPDMTAGSDSGVSASDNITNTTTPTFTGTAEAGSTVTLYGSLGEVLGTGVATGGVWSITSSALPEGWHTLAATATDAAGNTSAVSDGLLVAIDTTAPQVNSVAAPANGVYRAGESLEFTVNLTEAVTVETAGGAPRLALTVGSSPSYATYVSGSGTSALVFRYTVQDGDEDADGVTVGSALDLHGGALVEDAGNAAALTLNAVASTANVRVDAIAPSAPSAPDMTAGSDSGASSTDNITSVSTPTFTGTAEAGSTVTLYDTDGVTVLGTGVATGGAWSITSSALSIGSHTVTAKAADAAGNVSAVSPGLAITIEAASPPSPPSPPAIPAATSGPDVIAGDYRDNVIDAGDGSDSISGGGGRDVLAGGAGDDVLQGNVGRDTLEGGVGGDVLRGGQDEDVLQGNSGQDLLFGDKGQDTVHGGQDADTIQGGQGDDYVSGDLGADIVRGGQGDDVLLGGAGDDYLSGDLGDDTLSGGEGADRFYVSAGAGADLVLDFNAAEGDRVVLSPGAQVSAAQVGADTVVTLTDGGSLVLQGVQFSSLPQGWIVAA